MHVTGSLQNGLAMIQITQNAVTFLERLRAAARAQRVVAVCRPRSRSRRSCPAGVALEDFLRGVVDATRDLVCCYKPNLAFFEALGLDGQRALRAVLKEFRPSIPVLDRRQTRRHTRKPCAPMRGPSSTTSTPTPSRVNPYLGGDSLEPFFDYADRGVFVLCKTSNPGAGEIQDLLVDGEPLFLHVARRARDLGQARHARSGRRRDVPRRRRRGARARAGRADPAARRRRAGGRPGAVGAGRPRLPTVAARSSTPAAACCTPVAGATGRPRRAREADRVCEQRSTPLAPHAQPRRADLRLSPSDSR